MLEPQSFGHPRFFRLESWMELQSSVVVVVFECPLQSWMGLKEGVSRLVGPGTLGSHQSVMGLKVVLLVRMVGTHHGPCYSLRGLKVVAEGRLLRS